MLKHLRISTNLTAHLSGLLLAISLLLTACPSSSATYHLRLDYVPDYVLSETQFTMRASWSNTQYVYPIASLTWTTTPTVELVTPLKANFLYANAVVPSVTSPTIQNLEVSANVEGNLYSQSQTFTILPRDQVSVDLNPGSPSIKITDEPGGSTLHPQPIKDGIFAWGTALLDGGMTALRVVRFDLNGDRVLNFGNAGGLYIPVSNAVYSQGAFKFLFDTNYFYVVTYDKKTIVQKFDLSGHSIAEFDLSSSPELQVPEATCGCPLTNIADGNLYFATTKSLQRMIGSTGKIDTQFGVASFGKLPSNFQTRDIDVDSSGKVYVTGSKENIERHITTPAIFRFNNNGSPDETFGQNGLVEIITPVVLDNYSDVFNRLEIMPDGSLLVGGSRGHGFTFGTSNSANSSSVTITKFNANGLLDQSFGVAGRTTVQSVSDIDTKPQYSIYSSANGITLVNSNQVIFLTKSGIVNKIKSLRYIDPSTGKYANLNALDFGNEYLIDASNTTMRIFGLICFEPPLGSGILSCMSGSRFITVSL